MELQVSQLEVSDYLLDIEASPQRPNNAETAYLRAQLQIAEDELHRLDVDLAILHANRSRIIRHIHRCRTALAPYSKLPGELIQEIIKWYIRELQPLPLRDGKEDPRVQITQVCSSWRSVAFGIPELWDVYLECLPTNSTLSLISAWFRQCSSTQLSFTMPSNLRDSPLFRSALLVNGVIAPCARRFRSLGSFPLDIGELNSLPFDVLSSLSFRFLKSEYSRPAGHIIVPSLRHFEVTEVVYLRSSTLLQHLCQIPWDKLTSLSLAGRLSVGDVYEVLAKCTSLERCQLFNIDFDSQRMFENASLHVPHLREFAIEFGSPVLFHRLFMFSVPKISSLSISLPPNVEEILHKFITFAATIKGPVHRLAITEKNPSTDVLEEICRAFPLITHFCAKERPIPPTILSKIGTGELFPEIEHLEFRGPGGMGLDRILDFIPQQPIWTSRLKKVSVHTDLWVSPIIRQRISDLHSQGMSVLVLHPARNKS